MQNTKVIIPPIKTQGKKTKLVDFIINNLNFSRNEQLYIEPFLGSGVIAFNLKPKKAILNDINIHIINFYKKIQTKEINSKNIKTYLEVEGLNLKNNGDKHYYYIRDRFNDSYDSKDFLFLNRACFNGVMRFNSKQKFNVPFCKNNERFNSSLITKICNQIDSVSNIITDDWIFVSDDWKNVLNLYTKNNNFLIYADPPYIGLNTGYYTTWNEHEANELANYLINLNKNFAYSMWGTTPTRKNIHLEKWFSQYEWKKFSHFYHVGPNLENRNSVEEILVLA